VGEEGRFEKVWKGIGMPAVCAGILLALGTIIVSKGCGGKPLEQAADAGIPPKEAAPLHDATAGDAGVSDWVINVNYLADRYERASLTLGKDFSGAYDEVCRGVPSGPHLITFENAGYDTYRRAQAEIRGLNDGEMNDALVADARFEQGLKDELDKAKRDLHRCAPRVRDGLFQSFNEQHEDTVRQLRQIATRNAQ
jgi:hypothetical protein